jgi:hypothetical protein
MPDMRAQKVRDRARHRIRGLPRRNETDFTIANGIEDAGAMRVTQKACGIYSGNRGAKD